MATPPKNPTDGTTPPAPPPAPRKPATPRKTTTRKAASSTPTKAPPARKAAAKPSARATPSPAAKPTAKAKQPAPKNAPAARKAASTGRKWGLAAVIGGVGAAVTAGVLALRGSTPLGGDTKSTDAKPDHGKTAHQADGTDSSKSFEAGIADEGTIPE